MSEPKDTQQKPAVRDRWWVDTGAKPREKVERPKPPVGNRFFRSGEGFEQDRARARLTDNNLKMLLEANPPEGGWSYVRLMENAHPKKERERLQRRVALPRYARGVFVDSGRTVRLLITGTPIGRRILELCLTEPPTFDCWIDDDWVRESVFKDDDEALSAFKRLIEEYLSPQAIAKWESLRAHA
jgi:hypothetical protein